VNRARFEREEKEESLRSKPERNIVEKRTVEPGTMFRGTLMGERRLGKEAYQCFVHTLVDVLPEAELLDELENCFVGRLTLHMEAETLQTCLFMEGWRGITVVQMGEKLVSLKANRKEVITSAMEGNTV